MISELKGSAEIPFPSNDREGHEFTRAVKSPDPQRLLAAEVRSFLLRPQGLKPNSLLASYGTTKVVPFHEPFGTTKVVPFHKPFGAAKAPFQTIPLPIFSTFSHA
jgi:hypothetical protein